MHGQNKLADDEVVSVTLQHELPHTLRSSRYFRDAVQAQEAQKHARVALLKEWQEGLHQKFDPHGELMLVSMPSICAAGGQATALIRYDRVVPWHMAYGTVYCWLSELSRPACDICHTLRVTASFTW